MEWKKAKNLILSVLVLANLFLLLNLSTMLMQRQRSENEKIAVAVSVLNDRGYSIELATALALPSDMLIYEQVRNYEHEAQIAKNLLGQCEKKVLGGGIEEYIAESGKVIFRNGGVFSFELYGIDASDKTEEITRQVLTSAFSFKGEIEGNMGEATGYYKINQKYFIEDYAISAIQIATKGLKISGRLFEERNAQTVPAKWDIAELLINLDEQLGESGQGVRVENLSVVYRCENITASESSFVPVLKVSTANLGDFYIRP